ncbi:Uncharacterized protein Rs2_37498 [Raphanus sativus]|nr:Uncharacterized protein Rs2_37498 [Raphanus sativus]
MIWKDPTRNKNLCLILELLYQPSCYTVWKERNTRLHSAASRPAASLIDEIGLTIRSKLDFFLQSSEKTSLYQNSFVYLHLKVEVDKTGFYDNGIADNKNLFNNKGDVCAELIGRLEEQLMLVCTARKTRFIILF